MEIIWSPDHVKNRFIYGLNFRNMLENTRKNSLDKLLGISQKMEKFTWKIQVENWVEKFS